MLYLLVELWSEQMHWLAGQGEAEELYGGAAAADRGITRGNDLEPVRALILHRRMADRSAVHDRNDPRARKGIDTPSPRRMSR
jgi:hypothetical protein